MKIGVQTGLTGAYSAVGASVSNGATLAAKLANDAGGIDGRDVEAVVLDDTSDKPAQAATNTETLISQGVPIIINSIGANTLASLPGATEAGVVSFLTTSWDVISASGGIVDATKFFIQIDAKTTVGPLSACYAVKGFDGKRVALISSSTDPSGAGFLEGMEGWVEEYDGELIKSVGIAQPFTDATAQLRSILDEDPDVIINLVSGAGGVVVQKNLQDLGSKVPVVGGVVWATTGALAEIGTAANGVVIANNFSADFPTPYQEEFTEAYEAEFGVAPDTFAAAAFDSFNVAILALTEYPDAKPGDAEELAAFIEGVQMPGVMAEEISFKPFDEDNLQNHSSLKRSDLQFFEIDGGGSGVAPKLSPVASTPEC